jgi:23S rRNA (adenine2503-C2)-methyltransferase
VAAPKYFTVNLIPYNTTAHEFKTPGKERVLSFSNLLLTLNVSCTVRKSLGADIAGACGQLADSDNPRTIKN